MQQPKLLIAESNEELRQALQQLLQETHNIRTCSSGDQALELLRTFCPDVVYMDVMLPKIDGLAVLQAAAQEGIRPISLVSIVFDSSYIHHVLDRLQVGYVVRKPCAPKAIAGHLIDLSRSAADVSQGLYDTNQVLLQLGLGAHRDGYQYLVEALPLFARNPQQALTKELYPAVGKVFGKSGALVERSMRSAIHGAWLQRNEAVWRRYFTPTPDGSIPRPTNAQMLHTLLRVLSQQENQWEIA